MLNMLTAQHINKSCKHSDILPRWVIKRVYKRKKKKKLDKQLIGLICVIDKSQDLRVKIPAHIMISHIRIETSKER